jgi:hypothetical protein
MINKKNNNFKKIIFAAIILLVFILALRYYMKNDGGEGIPGASLLKKAGETGVSDPFQKNPEQKAETVPPAANPSRLTETAGAISGAAASSEASLNVQTVTARPGSHSVKQTALAGKKGVITGNGVNLRRESRIDISNSNVITKINKGEQVQIIGAEKPANDNKQWYNIKLKNGKTGFVREDLIKIE